MPDIREVLDGAAPAVGDPDVEGIARRARSRRSLPRAMAASVLVIAAVAGTVVVATHDGSSPRRIDSGTTPSVPTTAPAPTQPPATTAPPTTTFAPGEDRLSTESRLGYAGLGPIKLGMSFDDAVAAAHVTVSEPTGCDLILYGQPGSGVESVAVWGPPVVDTITVYRPGIRTISGIGVGSTRADVLATYTDAEPRVAWYRGSGVPTTLVITSASGNVIEFSFTEDGTDTVSRMTLSTSLATIDGHAVC